MSSSWAGRGPSAPPPTASASDTRPKKAASRQLLSCTKCRERKVKCDRIQPCAACCARGQSKECVFVVTEGNDYQPIPQSYEIRKLREEVKRLREKLVKANLSHSGDEDEDDVGADRSSKAAAKQAAGRQRRFKTFDRTDNIYFGTPGLATVVDELARLRLMNGAPSLTHPMPGMTPGRKVYGEEDSYPFQVVLNYTSVPEFLELLPDKDKIFEALDLFEKRAQSCSFPHLLDEMTKHDVERFLSENKQQRINNAMVSPDMLALIFTTLAVGMQMSRYDSSGGRWVKEEVEKTRRTCNSYISASMHLLRLASFMNHPTLLAVQTLVMMGPYLTNNGRFLDAWTLFGTTIRLAHALGLHRDPRLLDPTPDLRESRIRQTLWWWMLHMDQQYSVTLGRPLGISGYGDCPQPQVTTTNATELRLYKFIDDFTITARQILGSGEMTNLHKIDEYTDKLINLWDTMPYSLQFTEKWVQKDTPLPEWPLEALAASLYAKVQSFMILLNRQRLERVQVEGSPETHTATYDLSNPDARHPPYRGRPLVIHSSISILQTFLFFWHRNKAVLVCWTMGQQAFNAAMILLIDAWEMDHDSNIWIVEQAYSVFVELNNQGVHRLAEHASERIFAALQQIETRKAEREDTSGMMASYMEQQQQQQQQQQQTLLPDTAPMYDLSGDSVMGSTGTFLLEDPGLQFQASTPQYPSFRPWGWSQTESSAQPANLSGPPSPQIPSPNIPVSQMTAAPFPVMPTAPISPYAIGLQPRMAPTRRSTAPNTNFGWHPAGGAEMNLMQSTFTPINAQQPHLQSSQQQQRDYIQQQIQYQAQVHQPGTMYPQPHPQQQQSFSQYRGLRHSHAPVPVQPTATHQHQSGPGTGGRPQINRSITGPKSQRRNR